MDEIQKLHKERGVTRTQLRDTANEIESLAAQLLKLSKNDVVRDTVYEGYLSNSVDMVQRAAEAIHRECQK